jgi:hypothetical protein
VAKYGRPYPAAGPDGSLCAMGYSHWRVSKVGCVWTNTTGAYSRYTQKYLLEEGIQTTIIQNFDTKEEALAVETDLISRASGPHNRERYAGSKSTGETPMDILRDFKGGATC